MSKHTPEPWEVRRGTQRYSGQPTINRIIIDAPINDKARKLIAALDGPFMADEAENLANFARIVACVNACEGMDDPERQIANLRSVLARHVTQQQEHMAQLMHLQDVHDAEVTTLRDTLAELVGKWDRFNERGVGMTRNDWAKAREVLK